MSQFHLTDEFVYSRFAESSKKVNRRSFNAAYLLSSGGCVNKSVTYVMTSLSSFVMTRSYLAKLLSLCELMVASSLMNQTRGWSVQN